MNHDTAWLLEATRRWMDGGRLYVDIVEINPPLIFLENLLLTGGTLTKAGYLAGTAIAIAVSSFWSKKPLIVSAALTLPALHDFGQRDHLALIFLTPYLLVDDRKQRLPLILWAFLGMALKPHFLIMPLAFALAKRNREALIDFVVLAGLCCMFWMSAVLIWPTYLSEIVPLGNAVYAAFGRSPGIAEAAIAILAILIAAFVAVRDKSLLPLAAAAIGAVVCFLMQGRYWNYHLVPAVGLSAMVVWLAASRTTSDLMKLGLVLVGSVMVTTSALRGKLRYHSSVIPQGVGSVLFLSDSVPAAYPMVTECGIVNTSRYPTFWTLPGSWNSGNKSIFEAEIAKANEDLRRYRPEIIFEDRNLRKFKPGFRFVDWIDLSNYRRVEGGGDGFQAWLRQDLSASIFDRAVCR